MEDTMLELRGDDLESDEAIAAEINAKAMAPAPRLVDQQADHYANLIDMIPENALNKLGPTLAENVESDLKSREEWMRREAEGLEALGIGPNSVDRNYDSMTDAALPIVLQAVVQFQARVMREIWPANRPAKVKRADSMLTFAPVDEDRADSQHRTEAHFNYQLLHEDSGGYDEDARLVAYTAFRGSGFKELYRDEEADVIRSEFIPGKNVIVPYRATNLRTLNRFAIIEDLSYGRIMRMVESGDLTEEFYAELPKEGDLQKGSDVTPEISQMEDLQQGSEPSDMATSDLEEDATYTFYRVHVMLDLQLHEWADPVLAETRGKGSRVPAPYVVRVHKDTGRIASIHRDWDPDDPTCQRDLRLVKYGLIRNPFGFYDLGYLHLLGNLDSASTAILTAIVDGGIRASNQGGFMAASLGAKGKAVSMVPGWYEALDVPAPDLAKAFFTPDFKPPAPVLFQVLGFLGQQAQALGSSTEALTGTAGASGPVGTIMALIEQGMEVYQEIYRGFHRARTEEYQIRARLNRRFLPVEGHKFTPPGANPIEIYIEDYESIGELVPVSDPQVASPQLRIARAEAILQLAERAPGIHDQYEVFKRMYEALQVEDADEILIDPADAFTGNPAIEEALMGLGKPVRVDWAQNHAAHMASHAAFLSSAVVAQLAEPQQMAIQMHMSEHVMLGYLHDISRKLQEQGLPPLPPVDIYERRSAEILQQAVPPGQEDLMAQATAQAATMFAQENPAPEPEGDPAEDEHEQKLEHLQELHEQDMAHRGQEHELALKIKAEEAALKREEELAEAKSKAADMLREAVTGPAK